MPDYLAYILAINIGIIVDGVDLSLDVDDGKFLKRGIKNDNIFNSLSD